MSDPEVTPAESNIESPDAKNDILATRTMIGEEPPPTDQPIGSVQHSNYADTPQGKAEAAAQEALAAWSAGTSTDLDLKTKAIELAKADYPGSSPTETVKHAKVYLKFLKDEG